MFTKEVAEGEEAPEPTEEEAEQGPEPLSTLDKDGEVEGGEAWTPVSSSTNSGVKNQVVQPDCSLTPKRLQPWHNDNVSFIMRPAVSGGCWAEFLFCAFSLPVNCTLSTSHVVSEQVD